MGLKTSKQHQDDVKYINRLRKELGLKPLKSGKRDCLKCDSTFYTIDLANQHLCNGCRNGYSYNENNKQLD